MFICSLLEGSNVKDKIVSSNVNLQVPEEPVPAHVVLSGKSIKGPVSNVAEGETDIFLRDLAIPEGKDEKAVYRVGKPNGRKGNITYEMIADTEDNPLIAVYCNKISFFEGVEADIRFICLDGGIILATLVSGACSFNGVPMQRCNTVNINGLSEYEYTSEELLKLIEPYYYNRDIDYCYNRDVVGAFTIIRSNGTSTHVKGNFNNPLFINSDTYESKLQKYEERQKKIEAEKEAKRVQRAQAMEEARKRAAEEEERRKQEIEKKKLLKEANLKDEDSKVVQGSAGAAAFLAAVRNLQQ